MKEKGYVMLEDFGDDNNWRWYEIFEDSTPEQALRYYEDLQEFDHEPITKDDGENHYYLSNGQARAYIIELSKPLKS